MIATGRSVRAAYSTLAARCGVRAAYTLIAALSLCGCGGGSDAGPDAGSDARACARPDPAPPWLMEYQEDIVARLSGERVVPTGVLLADRATAQNRAGARALLRQAFTDLGLTPEEHDYGTGVNVHATLAATRADADDVIVGAHYDSVPASPGANDNATGVAAVYAAARYAAELPCRDANVVFVLFDEEERGFTGSERFVNLLVSEQRTVVAAHTFDQLGWDDDGDGVVELELPAPELAALYRDAAAALGIAVVETNSAASDHVAFRNAGIAVTGVTEEFSGGDTTPHFHLPSDRLSTVNLGYLAAATSLIHAALAAALDPTSRP